MRFYSVCSPDRDRPFGVIRQRIRSDYEYPDLGQVMYWRLWWEFTPALVEDARGECDNYIDEISRPAADYIAAHLADRYWPPDAAGCRGDLRLSRATEHRSREGCCCWKIQLCAARAVATGRRGGPSSNASCPRQ